MISLATDFHVETCCHEGCGIVFAMPAHFVRKRREDHTLWYCPNGHAQLYKSESEAERLRKDLIRTQARLDQEKAHSKWQYDRAERAGRSANALRGVLTRTRRRVGKGVCPCCNRHFRALWRHMETKHPGYGERP